MLKQIIHANKISTGLILGILTTFSITMAWQTLTQESRYSKTTMKPGDFTGLRSAVQNFWQDHQDELKNAPQQVSPLHLAKEGYLDLSSAERWNYLGINIRLPEAVTGAKSASDVVIEAKMKTGDRIVLLADGSVQDR